MKKVSHNALKVKIIHKDDTTPNPQQVSEGRTTEGCGA